MAMPTKKPENVTITKFRVLAVSDSILGDFDEILDGDPNYGNVVNGAVVNEVVTVKFSFARHTSALTMRVYEDGTFRVGSAMGAFTPSQIEAYGRAAAFIKALELAEA
jgi:hypothetical protein